MIYIEKEELPDSVKEKIIGLSDFLEVEKLRSSFGGKKSYPQVSCTCRRILP